MKTTKSLQALLSLIIITLGISSWTIKSIDGEIIKPGALIAAQESQKSERMKPNAKSREGYTVLLFFSDDKTAADKTKITFDQQFQNKYPCIVEWNEPKFKVFAGAFLTRAEAVSLLYKAREMFPKAMIIKTKI